MHSHRGLAILKANASFILLWMALSVGVISSFFKLVNTHTKHSWDIISNYKLTKLKVFILAKFLLVEWIIPYYSAYSMSFMHSPSIKMVRTAQLSKGNAVDETERILTLIKNKKINFWPHPLVHRKENWYITCDS